MSVTRKKRAAVFAVGLSCLLAGYAVAQQIVPGQPGQTDRATQPGVEQPRTAQPGVTQRDTGTQRTTATAAPGAASSDVDRYLAACWQAHNQAEVELSRLAERQSQNPQVKQFAQMMAQDHGKLAPQIQQLAGGQASATTSPNASRDLAGTQRLNTQGNQAGNQLINRLISIDKQIVDRKMEMARQELESKEGADFDKCYIGSQIAAHMQASAALDVMSQQASGELKQLASQAKQTVDNHLEQAKQIAQQLEGQQPTGPRQAGRPQTGVIRDRELQPAGAEQR